jgi:hypothetical protein
MTLRHSSRHVHQTVAKKIEDQLVALGWTDPLLTPFGATALRFQTSMPADYEASAKLAPGTVAITMMREFDSMEEEMGGPLASYEMPLFIDIFMENESLATAVALDVRDTLKGRFNNMVTIFPVLDFTQPVPTPVTGWQIELEDWEMERSERSENWMTCRITARVYFPNVAYTPVVNA